MKLLLSGATLLLFFGLFGCSNDDSGGSVFCDSQALAPETIVGATLDATIDASSSAAFCQDENGSYDGTFSADTYDLAYTGSEECDSTSGNYTYSAEGSIGTVDADQTAPETAVAKLELCVTEIEVFSGTTTYKGNYRLTAEGDTGSQTGTFDLVPGEV